MKLEQNNMIYIASVAIEKNMDYETLKYSDYMHGNESETENVWEYVEEAKKIGSDRFKSQYPEAKFFPGF